MNNIKKYYLVITVLSIGIAALFGNGINGSSLIGIHKYIVGIVIILIALCMFLIINKENNNN